MIGSLSFMPRYFESPMQLLSSQKGIVILRKTNKVGCWFKKKIRLHPISFPNANPRHLTCMKWFTFRNNEKTGNATKTLESTKEGKNEYCGSNRVKLWTTDSVRQPRRMQCQNGFLSEYSNGIPLKEWRARKTAHEAAGSDRRTLIRSDHGRTATTASLLSRTRGERGARGFFSWEEIWILTYPSLGQWRGSRPTQHFLFVQRGICGEAH